MYCTFCTVITTGNALCNDVAAYDAGQHGVDATRALAGLDASVDAGWQHYASWVGSHCVPGPLS